MRYREEDSYATITLIDGGVCLVSACDYWWLSCMRWMTLVNGTCGHKYVAEVEWRILMHRLVMGTGETQIIDHANGNTLDNRRENLRLCSHRENAYNQSARGGKSKYKGVFLHSQTGHWTASISHNYTRVNLGYFTDEHDAALAYDEGAKKYHGRFARLNFPYGFDRQIFNSASRIPIQNP